MKLTKDFLCKFSNLSYEYEWFLFFFFIKRLKSQYSLGYRLFCHLFYKKYQNCIHRQNFEGNHFSRAVRSENFLYGSRGGPVHLYLSQRAVYRIVAIDVRSRREGKDLRRVGFYDPIKNQTYLNVPVILYFLEIGAQPTVTVHNLLKKSEIFKQLLSNFKQTKLN